MASGWRRGASVAMVALFSSIAFVRMPPIPISPRALLNLPMTMFGPYNTEINHGYENDNHVSPIMPGSYRAEVSPQLIGLQFIGDRDADLQRDHFEVQLEGPGYHDTPQALDVFRSGFAGYRLPHRLQPGTYHVTFLVTGFDTPNQKWSITVLHRVVPETAESRTAHLLLDSLNTIRSAVNESPIAWNRHLQLASKAHTRYLFKNGYNAPSFHMESASHRGYTGNTPWARDLVFGWPTSVTGEVGIEWQTPADTVTVIPDLIDTVYHRLSLLSDNLLAAGEGEDAGKNGSVVMDLGFGYRNTLPKAIVYPYNGEPGIPTGWVDLESPDPVKNGYDNVYGYPITADFPTVDMLSHVTMSLRQGGHVVPIVEDLPNVNGMGANQVGMVPISMLAAETLYTVRVSADAVFNDGTVRPIAITWRFSTGGSSQSLAATVESQRHVVISDVTSGLGTPEPFEPLTLYRRDHRRALIRVDSGQTNVDGIWSVELSDVHPGYYEVVSATNNATVFWWGKNG